MGGRGGGHFAWCFELPCGTGWKILRILGGFWLILEGSWGVFFQEAFRRRVAVLFRGREGWAACSSGCRPSVSSRPVSPVPTTIELSSQPVALKFGLRTYTLAGGEQAGRQEGRHAHHLSSGFTSFDKAHHFHHVNHNFHDVI